MMNYAISILLLASFPARAIAGKFSLPIEKTERVLSGITPLFASQHVGIQRPINSNSKPTFHVPIIPQEDSESRGSPVLSRNTFYTTNLSIGTPPQSFRAIIDLNWSDLFLPSSTCHSVPSQYCNPSNATYNASASSTYHENGNITRIIYGPSYAWAQLSEDTLTFPGGLQVPKQVFHEIKHYEYVYDYGWGCEFFDGVLGLAADPSFTVPYWWGTPNVLPGQFKSMVDNNVLDTNMFSIVWPTEAREQGTITFGGYDEDLLEGELVPHALFPKNTTLWQVELEGLTLTDHYSNEVLVDTPLPQVRDHFLSFHPIIGLNYYLAQSLLKHMHTWPSACVRYPIVDCDRLPSLPEIVFRFKGQNVTLRGEDYVRKLKTPTNCPDADDACHVMFDYLGSQKDLVLLGTPFLERVMGVFNWDERTDSFGELKK